MTTKMEERYEGQFLDALDLPEGVEVPVTIEKVVDPFVEKDSTGKVIKSAILSFKGKVKRLIINKTNYKNLKAMFGREPKNWIGKSIKLQRRYLDAGHGFGVNNTLAIRIIPPIGTPILRSAVAYMGSPTPYGPNGRPTKARQHQAAGPKAAEQESLPSQQQPHQTTMPDDLEQWMRTVAKIESIQECAEFQALLEDCPESIRAQVQLAFEERRTSLTACSASAGSRETSRANS